ncbi:hypothetical protein ACFVZC_03000 [Streptomyces marokkonensis]|uniref:Uncharacterized protein n=1 Tax=Streptomyces marokkonensis TaxID=324855 RepID=A0ABW6PZM9_9ACTN
MEAFLIAIATLIAAKSLEGFASEIGRATWDRLIEAKQNLSANDTRYDNALQDAQENANEEHIARLVEIVGDHIRRDPAFRGKIDDLMSNGQLRALVESSGLGGFTLHHVQISRRGFLVAASTAAAVNPPAARALLGDEGFRQERVDSNGIQKIAERISEIRSMDGRIPSSELRPHVQSDLIRLESVLGRGSYTAEVGRQLHEVTADLSFFAGWLAFNDGRAEAWKRYYHLALTAAISAGDRALEAAILGFTGFQLLNSSPTEAAAFGELARAHGARSVGPGVAAHLAAMSARSHARSGNARKADSALRSAWDYLGRDDHNNPSWAYAMDEAELTGITGLVHLELGRLDLAQDTIRQGLDLREYSAFRTRGIWLNQLASAHLRQGDARQACVIGIESLSCLRASPTPRGAEGVRTLVRNLRRYRRIREVREFNDLARATLQSLSL